MSEIKTATMGHVRQEEVRYMEIPRAEFERVVAETLGEDASDMLREEMTALAKTMDRFPFDNWIVAGRGCGCMVGEAMVARRVFSREDAVAMIERDMKSALFEREFNVERLLREAVGPDEANGYDEFGLDIDLALKAWADDAGLPDDEAPLDCLVIV